MKFFIALLAVSTFAILPIFAESAVKEQRVRAQVVGGTLINDPSSVDTAVLDVSLLSRLKLDVDGLSADSVFVDAKINTAEFRNILTITSDGHTTLTDSLPYDSIQVRYNQSSDDGVVKFIGTTY